MGKGSKRRPQVISDSAFADAWDKIFARKKTPPQGRTQVHTSKKVYNRNRKIEE